MNWFLIFLIIAIVLCVVQSFEQMWPPPRPRPHWGWLAFAFVIAAVLARHA